MFSFARHWTLNDERPSYVKVPREIVDERGRINEVNGKLLFAVAREAVTQRAQGLRNYISFFEAELARRVEDGDTAHKERAAVAAHCVTALLTRPCSNTWSFSAPLSSW